MEEKLRDHEHKGRYFKKDESSIVSYGFANRERHVNNLSNPSLHQIYF